MKKKPRKLVLAKETVRDLTPELRLVAGGLTELFCTQTCSQTCLRLCTVVSNPMRCFSPPSNNC